MRCHLRRTLTTISVILVIWLLIILTIHKEPASDKKASIFEDDPIWQRRKNIEKIQRFDKVEVTVNDHENAKVGWNLYMQYKTTGTHIWPRPALEDDDRILNQIHHVHTDDIGKKLKKILVYDGLEHGMKPGQSRFIDHQCPVNQCSLTEKSYEASTADAILFKNGVRMPTQPRPTHQIWIVFNLESPHHTASYYGMDNLVNWTATYRTDSVMVAPYEKFAYFTNYSLIGPAQNYASGKTKLVAWFVSNCGAPNGRMNYVKELEKHIAVDIYGACGTSRCLRSDHQCFEMLSRDYKYYLSFENSNCQDYITEKFFVNALSNNVLPVVMGARPEDYKRLAPPGSYIHVDDFDSPKQLAEYLLMLDKDDSLYNTYFNWKTLGTFIDTKFWCRLCTLVHESHRSGHHITVNRLDDWWRGPGVCQMPSHKHGELWSTWRHSNPLTSSNTTNSYNIWTEPVSQIIDNE